MKPKGPLAEFIAEADTSLLDLVDNLLDKGAVVHGQLVLSLAGVDLIFVQLSVVLCAADKVLRPRP